MAYRNNLKPPSDFVKLFLAVQVRNEDCKFISPNASEDVVRPQLISRRDKVSCK
jgi:hypothetical protein